jgi:hypothetical protein
MDKINRGDLVEITCQGLTVEGVVTYADHDYEYIREHEGADPVRVITGYDLEIRSVLTQLPHRWKSKIDGGTVKILLKYDGLHDT